MAEINILKIHHDLDIFIHYYSLEILFFATAIPSQNFVEILQVVKRIK